MIIKKIKNYYILQFYYKKTVFCKQLHSIYERNIKKKQYQIRLSF